MRSFDAVALDTFLALNAATIAQTVQRQSECWAISLGGTRRAYLAAGGVLETYTDLEAYFTWIVHEHCRVLEHLYALGIGTIVAIGRIPTDRGGEYTRLSREATLNLVEHPAMRAWYDRLHVRVRAAGDLTVIEAATNITHLHERFTAIADATAAARGPQLIYLFCGEWTSTIEEASWGYTLGTQLGRMPTRNELVAAYYGIDVSPLTVFVGSGRPRVGYLRPPFLGGSEDLYWSHTSPVRLREADWRRILYDHITARTTKSARGYPHEADQLVLLRNTLAMHDGHIVGLGQQHPLGFWLPTS